MGFQTTGAASELFAVDAARVLKLPPGMSLDHGAMVEPVAVGVHALGRAGAVAGLNVLVLGAGPIGNLAAQAASGLGAAQVMITDVSEYRLEKARECGICLRVNVAAKDLGEAIRTHFGPKKADLILECVGSSRTIGQAIDVARKGTDIIVVGVFGDRPVVDMGTVQDRELRLSGTLMYREPDWKKAIELISRGRVCLAPLVTDRFPFARYAEAYQYIDANRDRAMKVMISVDE
jgi:L-iditol 2-dehydrogenase